MERILASRTVKLVGKKIKVCGWVWSRRDHGKLVFIDLKDRSGLIQIVLGQEAGDLREQDVVLVEGEVKKRPKDLVNPKLPTGEVEVKAEKIEILARSDTPPFPLDSDGLDIDEDLRLKYRYLDLRRPRLQKNIKLRSDLIQKAREYLFENDFVEIETPLLTKSTPEGSRDFLVPSRLQPGKFYALPQSPQQYKQLLMVSGFEHYFQIARAIRDEDLRADRAFEHTQIDIEMSFVKREDVMKIVEGMMIYALEKNGLKIKQKPFPVFSFKEAMKKFGSDKFDLRSEKEKENNVQSFAWVVDFPFFEKTEEGEWTYTHNPFSDPVPEDKEAFLKGKIEGILTTQYDLVCNGYETAGGSIRSTDPKILSQVFEVLGHSKKNIEKKFGHMLKAFQFGVPPHGGIAVGVERLVMCAAREESLRETVAFPTTSSGKTAVMDAPSEIDEKQLAELGIKKTDSKKQNA